MLRGVAQGTEEEEEEEEGSQLEVQMLTLTSVEKVESSVSHYI